MDFQTRVNEFLEPILLPGAIVVLDDLGAHRDQRIRAAIKAAGAISMFFPPYSPELNPIKECWCKVKGILRSAKALGKAVKLVTAADADGWFRHAGHCFSS